MHMLGLPSSERLDEPFLLLAKQFADWGSFEQLLGQVRGPACSAIDQDPDDVERQYVALAQKGEPVLAVGSYLARERVEKICCRKTYLSLMDDVILLTDDSLIHNHLALHHLRSLCRLKFQ